MTYSQGGYVEGQRLTPSRKTKVLKVTCENGKATYHPQGKNFAELGFNTVAPPTTSLWKARRELKRWIKLQKSLTPVSVETLKGV